MSTNAILLDQLFFYFSIFSIFFLLIHLFLQFDCLLLLSYLISLAYFSRQAIIASLYFAFYSSDFLQYFSFQHYFSCFHSSEAAFVTQDMLLNLCLAAISALFSCKNSKQDEVGAFGLCNANYGFIFDFIFFLYFTLLSSYFSRNYFFQPLSLSSYTNIFRRFGSKRLSICLKIYSLASQFSLGSVYMQLESSQMQNQVIYKKKLAFIEAIRFIQIAQYLRKYRYLTLTASSILSVISVELVFPYHFYKHSNIV